MIKRCNHHEVRQMMEEGAQIVEVLPETEYQDEHIVGAIHLPLKQLNAQTASRLAKDKPIIVYCHDSQ